MNKFIKPITTRLLIVFLFVMLFLLTAWIPSITTKKQGLPTNQNQTLKTETTYSAQEESPSANTQKQDSPRPSASGEIYFILKSNAGFKLAYLPIDCLLQEIACPKVEFIANFPSTKFNFQSFAWSPNGKVAFISNGNTGQILMFSPEKEHFEYINQPIYTRIIWNPDGQWAIANTQSQNPESTQLVLFDENGAQHPLNVQIYPFQYVYPVGWVRSDEIIAVAQKLEHPEGDPSRKKEITETKLIRVNVKTAEWHTIQTSLTTRDIANEDAAISSDGTQIAYSASLNNVYQLYVMNSDGTGITSLGIHASYPHWSWNNQWIASTGIASIETECLLYISHPDGTALKQFSLPGWCSDMLWLPNNEHLLVETRNSTTFDETFYIISINKGSSKEVSIPGLLGYFVEGFTLRTIPTP